MRPRRKIEGYCAIEKGVVALITVFFLSSCQANHCPEGQTGDSDDESTVTPSLEVETAYTSEFESEAVDVASQVVGANNETVEAATLGAVQVPEAEVKAADKKVDEKSALVTNEPGIYGQPSAAAARCQRAGESFADWAKKEGGTLQTLVVNLQSQRALFSHRAEVLVNPASNMKLLTAAVALELLGAQTRFTTRVYGDIEAHSIKRLVVKGGGAPDLTTSEFARFARVLSQMQVKEVGDIIVDQSRFDESFTPPAFAQQPKEWAPFRAPISALALDRNVVALNVMSTQAGKAAITWYEPPVSVLAQGRVNTGKLSSGDRVGWSLSGKPEHLDSILSGSLAEGSGRRRYRRRLEDPRMVPGFALSGLLRQLGVKVRGKVKLGIRQSEARLTSLPSAPLSELILPMGKESDNFTAEMLLVALSKAAEDAETNQQRPWSSERGAKVLSRYLKRHFKSGDSSVIKNGSGLFEANRISPRLIVELLDKMRSSSEFPSFAQHLSIGGRDGTLKKRMKTAPLLGRVRAKTGTLAAADALSGYVEAKAGGKPYLFSILVSGVRSQHYEARKRSDRFLKACIQEADAGF